LATLLWLVSPCGLACLPPRARAQVPVGTKGRVLKEAIWRKQGALALPQLGILDMRLFVHDHAGRQTSVFVGREVKVG
jgi:hypothetical protein